MSRLPPFPPSLGRRALLAAAATLLARPAAAAGLRVVSLDYGLTETLLALGIVPVGMPDPADYRIWVVTPTLPGGVMDVGQRTQPNLELLADLKPDLILAIQEHDPILPQLRQVAPVLRLPIYQQPQRPWDCAAAAARTLASWLGRPAAAEQLVERVEARCAGVRAVLAGRGVPPLLLASFLDPRHLRLYGGGGILQDGLDRMGLRNAWTGRFGAWGSATVGLEALAPLGDAALLVFEPRPPDLAAVLDASPLWQALPFVRGGRVMPLPPVLMFGTLPAVDRFAQVLQPVLRPMAALG